MPRPVGQASEHTTRLPGPAGRELVLEYFRKGGTFGVDRRRAPGGGATHVRISELDAAGEVVRGWVKTIDEATHVVDSVTAAWAEGMDGESTSGESESTPGERGRTPGERVVVVPRCGYCGIERENLGPQELVTKFALGANLGIDSKRVRFDVFACPRCGSVELFRPGFV